MLIFVCLLHHCLLDVSIFAEFPIIVNILTVKVQGQLTQKEYEQEITDLVNFLTYVSEPAQLERYSIGLWVMLFLVFFAFITYLLKIEYWRDIK